MLLNCIKKYGIINIYIKLHIFQYYKDIALLQTFATIQFDF